MQFDAGVAVGGEIGDEFDVGGVDSGEFDVVEGEPSEARVVKLLASRLKTGDVVSIPPTSKVVTGGGQRGGERLEAGRLAAELVENLFDGIRYYARHDPGFRLISVALFSSAESALSGDKPSPSPDDLIVEAEREFGLLVLPKAPLQ